MTLDELLTELEARGVKIEVIGGRVQLEAPPGAMAPWLQAALMERRAELLASLEPETGAAETAPASAETAPAAPFASGPGDVPASPPLAVGPEGALRIPLDDLVLGDFLEQNKLRIVDGAAYPDGRTFRPTIYLAPVRETC